MLDFEKANHRFQAEPNSFWVKTPYQIPLMKKIIIPCLMLVWTSLCWSGANAAVLVSMNATAPSTNVEASYATGSPSGYQWRNNTADGLRDLGQSFLANTSFVMDSFSLQLNGNIQAGVPGAGFTVTLFESVNQSSIGSVLATEGGVMPSLTVGTGAGQWMTFEISNVALTEGNYYTFILSFDTQAANRNQTFNTINPGTFTNGRAWQTTDGVTYTGLGSDLFFYVQSIPEPGSVVLVVMGGASVLVSRLRRRRQA